MIDSITDTDASPILASVRDARRVGDVRETARLATECVRVAEASHDALSAFHALTAVGLLHLSRAEPVEARPYFDAALDVVEVADLKAWRGPALHNAFIAARDAGDVRAGRRFAWGALEIYSDRREGHRVSLLSADVQEGGLQFQPSIEQARTTLSCWQGSAHSARSPRERMIARVNAMSAAALLLPLNVDHFRKLFFIAADGFQGALNECRAEGAWEDVARCLTEASVASSRIGDFPRAARVASDALCVALSRGEGLIAQAAGEARMAARAEKVPPPLWD
jgi:hypothetical protein